MVRERETAVAVVGLACRLPGAAEPAAFWRLLREGTSAITEVPAGRWQPMDERARHGGFLDDVDLFDAAFFGISPREAASMDPQQRLVLELGWEALEDAGIAADRLAGRPVGVFVGATWDDYATLHHRGREIGEHTLTGLNRSIIANRLSYFLDLTGPSLTVDTGQSSSLVAVHLGCESLRRAESEVAIVGGVNLNLAPESAAGAAGFGALSPDGRCYTFDARANGYVRGEGGGLVVLKPLSRALADGDRVYCVIPGSAVTADGAGRGERAGLTVPDRDGQERVLRQAHAAAGVSALDVDYVELHGTGTRVGDPVEAAALGAVFGTGRAEPLLVGSAKTNVGHLEAGAGIVGLIKTALAVAHREIPPSLNFADPNPEIPLADLGLRVQTQTTPWPRQAALAGVSSFGMGGTNCHVVVAAAPVPDDGRRAGRRRRSRALVPLGADAGRPAGAGRPPSVCCGLGSGPGRRRVLAADDARGVAGPGGRVRSRVTRGAGGEPATPRRDHRFCRCRLGGIRVLRSGFAAGGHGPGAAPRVPGLRRGVRRGVRGVRRAARSTTSGSTGRSSPSPGCSRSRWRCSASSSGSGCGRSSCWGTRSASWPRHTWPASSRCPTRAGWSPRGAG